MNREPNVWPRFAAWLALLILSFAWLVWCWALFGGVALAWGDSGLGSFSTLDWLAIGVLSALSYVITPLALIMAGSLLLQSRVPTWAQWRRIAKVTGSMLALLALIVALLIAWAVFESTTN